MFLQVRIRQQEEASEGERPRCVTCNARGEIHSLTRRNEKGLHPSVAGLMPCVPLRSAPNLASNARVCFIQFLIRFSTTAHVRQTSKSQLAHYAAGDARPCDIQYVPLGRPRHDVAVKSNRFR